MKFFEPIERVGNQEVANFGSTEIENVGAPVWMLASPWVGVLVERLPIESGQSPIIFWKVSWNPVENYADVGLVKLVDQIAKVVWAAEARGRCVVSRHLIAPGWPIGVFGKWHELDVSKAKFLYVWNQFVGQFAIVHCVLPRTGVQLINAHR